MAQIAIMNIFLKSYKITKTLSSIFCLFFFLVKRVMGLKMGHFVVFMMDMEGMDI